MANDERLLCPRCGGTVRLERVPGSATDPNDPLPSDHHYWCSPCGKLWHPVEMPRRSGRLTSTEPHP